jgi:hypothetical protein
MKMSAHFRGAQLFLDIKDLSATPAGLFVRANTT